MIAGHRNRDALVRTLARIASDSVWHSVRHEKACRGLAYAVGQPGSEDEERAALDWVDAQDHARAAEGR